MGIKEQGLGKWAKSWNTEIQVNPTPFCDQTGHAVLGPTTLIVSARTFFFLRSLSSSGNPGPGELLPLLSSETGAGAPATLGAMAAAAATVGGAGEVLWGGVSVGVGPPLSAPPPPPREA